MGNKSLTELINGILKEKKIYRQADQATIRKRICSRSDVRELLTGRDGGITYDSKDKCQLREIIYAEIEHYKDPAKKPAQEDPAPEQPEDETIKHARRNPAEGLRKIVTEINSNSELRKRLDRSIKKEETYQGNKIVYKKEMTAKEAQEYLQDQGMYVTMPDIMKMSIHMTIDGKAVFTTPIMKEAIDSDVFKVKEFGEEDVPEELERYVITVRYVKKKDKAQKHKEKEYKGVSMHYYNRHKLEQSRVNKPEEEE